MMGKRRTARRLVLVATLALGLFVVPATAAANPTIPGSTTGPNGLVYLPLYGAGSVTAVDPVANKVVNTYQNVGDHPLVAKMLPDHSKLFVGNFGPLGWSVSVIETATGKVTQIPTIGPAYAVSQLSHDGRYLYVPTGLSVTQVIDTQTLQTVRVLPILLPPGPAHLEVSADDKSLYVMSAIGTVTEYDAITGAMLKPPILLNGFAPGWGALTVDGDKLYAANYIAGVTVVDTKTWTVDRTMFRPPLSGVISSTLTPDGSKMWICGLGDGNIVVMDAQTGHVDRIIHSQTGAPVYAGFSDDGKTAYVSALDPTTRDFPDFLQLFKGVHAYLPPFNASGSLDQYDTATMTLKSSVRLPGSPIAGVYPG